MKRILLVFFLGIALNAPAFCEDKLSEKTEDKKQQMSLDEFVKEFNRGLSANKELFDKYFTENFFNINPEPFKEMEKIRVEMKDMIKSYNSAYFDRIWNIWYSDRMKSPDFGILIEEGKGGIVMKIVIPGLETNNVKVNISDKLIKIDGSYNKINEIKNKKGEVVPKSLEYSSFSKIMSLPDNVKSDGANIRTDKDQITINFQKK